MHQPSMSELNPELSLCPLTLWYLKVFDELVTKGFWRISN